MSSAHYASIIPTGPYGSASLRPDKYLRTLDPAAPAWQFEPAMAFNHDEVLQRHHLPIWNPFAGYGAPWAAGMLSQPFYPVSFLLSLHPSPRTVSWFLILRLLLAGYFAYLYLRFFVQHAAALVGGTAFMLTGYFIIFINIDHLSTETLLPLVFYAIERLLRESSVKSKLIAAASVYLTFVSGMPECTFLLLLYGSAYFIYRLLSAAQYRSRFRTNLTNFVLSTGLGAALATFLLLPFFEFLRNGLDSHRPSIVKIYLGMGYLLAWRKELVLYVFPSATGPPFETFGRFAGHAWGYCGLVVVILGILALISAIRARRHFWTRSDGPLILFFFASALAFFLKLFGSPVANWVGRLPLFNMLNFQKYLQPSLGFALASLAGFGAAYVFSRRARLVDVFAAPLLGLLVILLCCATFRRDLATHPANEYLFYLSIACGLATLLLLTAFLACCITPENHGKVRVGRFGRSAVIGLVALELMGNFIYPVFYRFTKLPPNWSNPYKGAPYIQVLQQHRDDYFRVFARDHILVPNWSSAFGLYDVRYIYGVNWNKFFYFIRSFLASAQYDRNGDLVDRFTGGGDYTSYSFQSWKSRRFLQLSSVRYLVSRNGFAPHLSPLITTVLAQNEQRLQKERLFVRREVFNISSDPRDVLFTHPITRRLAVATTISPAKPILAFSPALDPAVYGPQFGDGVDFTIELRDASGKIKPVYHRYIDPKHDPAERRWLDERIDLSQYRGKQVTLLFSTSGGPNDNTAWDWAGWGDLRFTGRTLEPVQSQSDIHEIYNKEVSVSEYADALPRASIFYAVDLVKSPEAALARLLEPSFDPWQRLVLVSSDSPDQAASRSLQTLSAYAGVRAQAAPIIAYDSQRTVIHATLDRPGIVMLTDSNYPGWNAYLDGRRVPILSANYLFRGVLAPAGSHTIEFRYQPASYFYGGLISLFALLLLAGWTFSTSQRGRAYWLQVKPSERIHAARVS